MPVAAPRDFPSAPRAAHAAAIAIVAALFVLVGARRAGALGPRDRHLVSARHGISVESPAGWTLSQHTGYGETVALLLHPDGSRISVSAAPTTAADAAALLEQNRTGLIAQGLQPSVAAAGPGGFLSVEMPATARGQRIRQLYLVREIPGGRQAVILTLICGVPAFPTHTVAIDFVAARLGLEDPATPADSGGPGAPTAGAPRAGAGGSGAEPRAHPRKRDAAAKEIQ